MQGQVQKKKKKKINARFLQCYLNHSLRSLHPFKNSYISGQYVQQKNNL